jgi:Restriction endonuclease NotI
MGKAAEVFTYPVNMRSKDGLEARKNTSCRCKGGVLCNPSANRNAAAKLKFENTETDRKIRELYGYSDTIPLGICSITGNVRDTETVESSISGLEIEVEQQQLRKPWIVCPHRLLYLGATVNFPTDLAQILELASGTRIGVWREIRLRYSDAGKKFEYNFDYVLHELDEANDLTGDPMILEVMTCSTSGGKIKDALRNALLNIDKDVDLGVNYRQVVGRMLSQLAVKCDVVSRWGKKAKCLWLIQDSLLQYIERTTGFDRVRAQDTNGNVHLLVYHLEQSFDPTNSRQYYPVQLREYIVGWDRAEKKFGHDYRGLDFLSMVTTPNYPPREALTKILTSQKRKSPMEVMMIP